MSVRRRRARRPVLARIVEATDGETGGRGGIGPALAEAGIYRAPPGQTADAVIHDIRGTSGARLAHAVTAASAQAARTPLVLLCEENQLSARAVRRAFGVFPVVIDGDIQRTTLCTLIHRAALRADMGEEAMVRVKVASLTGRGHGAAPDPSPSRRALLVGPSGPATGPLLASLGEEIDTAGVLTRGQALSLLEMRLADRLFLVPGPDRRPHATLLRLIRRHDALTDTPVAVIEPTPTESHRAYWERAGADGVFRPEDLVPAVAATGVLAAAREAEATLTASFALGPGSAAVRIPSTGPHAVRSPLCDTRLFEVALAQRAFLSHQDFSVGALRLFSDAGEDIPDGAFEEPALYISLGVTDMDLVTRARPDLLLFSLPGADSHNAERLMADLARMVCDLKFGPRTNPVTFRATSASVTLSPGQSTDQPVADLIVQMTARPAPSAALFA